MNIEQMRKNLIETSTYDNFLIMTLSESELRDAVAEEGGAG